jgi:hypothetical protein
MTAYAFPTDSPAAELWVLNEVESLVKLNRAHRAASDRPWFGTPVSVGSDGGVEAYVLDTSADPSPVLVYELESGKLQSYAPDYHEFIRLAAQALDEVEASERALAAAYHNSWWQFWIRPYPPKQT